MKLNLDSQIDNSQIKSTLIDAVRTTRKYGLGWMFISQNLAALDKTIIDQLRIQFFGFGLSLGAEFQALKEIVGGDQNTLKLYQSFRDPHSAFDLESRQYSFMTIGPVSPLSFAGTPLFFTAFNDVDAFRRANCMKETNDGGYEKNRNDRTDRLGPKQKRVQNSRYQPDYKGISR